MLEIGRVYSRYRVGARKFARIIQLERGFEKKELYHVSKAVAIRTAECGGCGTVRPRAYVHSSIGDGRQTIGGSL